MLSPMPLTLSDLLGTVLCGGLLLAIAGGLAWAIRRGLAQQRAFKQMLERRGWGVPETKVAFGQEHLVARGTHQGQTFELFTYSSGGKNGRTETRVRVPSPHAQGRLLLCPPVPDSGLLGAAVKFMLGGDLPPRWDGTPASLAGLWEVRGPAGLAAAVTTPALVAVLARWDRRKMGQPWLKLQDGQVRLAWQRTTFDEAELVALVELAIAASR